MRLGEEKGQAVLTVTDTGIGISPEHQERVFERFYRVDKSHSKEIGGTGLGLSIVKHAALILGAAIELDSTVGKGRSSRCGFPWKKVERREGRSPSRIFCRIYADFTFSDNGFDLALIKLKYENLR